MKIRKLKKEDIPALAEIVNKNYHSKVYRRSVQVDLKEMFAKVAVRPMYLVAEDKGEPVGFAGCMQSWMDYNVYLIFWVNVIPGMQRQGVGKKLVATTIDWVKKEKGLVVLLTTSSPKYYKSHFGFKTLELFKKKSYSLMSLSLEKKQK